MWGHKPWPQPFKGQFQVSLWPLGQQGAPGMGDVVLQALLSFTPGVPNATTALGIQNPAGAVIGGTKCHKSGAGMGCCCQPGWCSPQPEGEKLLLCHGRVSMEGEDLSLTVSLCRVKAKKGVNLLSTKSRSGQWLVSSELLTGGKHSTATVDVSRVEGAGPR